MHAQYAAADVATHTGEQWTPEMSGELRALEDLANSLKGRSAAVVGNGESRLGFDLTKLPEDMVVFGCNALYRDLTPDYLGAVDVRMTAEIIRAYAHGAWEFICVPTENPVCAPRSASERELEPHSGPLADAGQGQPARKRPVP
jgi:hypothetical protein